MIVTLNENEITSHTYLKETSQKIWRHARLNSEDAYFMVIYLEDKSKDLITELLWKVEDLIDICEFINVDKNLEMARVILLSPPNLNKSSTWKSEDLSEIWRVKNARGLTSLTYQTNQNNYTNVFGRSRQKWNKQERIFHTKQYLRNSNG